MTTQLDRIERKLNWAIEGIAALEECYGSMREEGKKRLEKVVF